LLKIIEEIVVPSARSSFSLRDPSGAYHSFQWPKRGVIDHRGHFPIAVGRKLDTNRAYDVFSAHPYKDAINEQQEVVFPLIERELCDVRLLTIRVRRVDADRPIAIARRTRHPAWLASRNRASADRDQEAPSRPV
jgi:hypothetical protein